MKQFLTAQHLASWAALCPGNQESAGKRKSVVLRGPPPFSRGYRLQRVTHQQPSSWFRRNKRVRWICVSLTAIRPTVPVDG
jgi:hypothetical protein